MFRNNLESIAGVSIYPYILTARIRSIFTVLIAYLVKMDKEHIEKASRIPLQNSELNND
ncbi:MAG: CcoQ/FixQ family Cbb3-type cytochrome c oxidase assembly chaperone [Bacteroidetes bacterium]|nr:CcoQ/FixQ family Cbb3-type cytochrome c oxidase assembly chaperone [Bacteroidota bacterium]